MSLLVDIVGVGKMGLASLIGILLLYCKSGFDVVKLVVQVSLGSIE